MDSLEHYASCPFQWQVFAQRFRKSSLPRSLIRFVGLLADSLDDKVFHSVHMFAVMSAYNSRKHARVITEEETVGALIWEGHRTAQLYHRGLVNRYNGILT